MATNHPSIYSDQEEEEEIGCFNEWGEEAEDELGFNSDYVCLFCDSNLISCNEVFEHCRFAHKFDFERIRKALGLDFYGSFKLINYVRSQVSENKCWLCGVACQSKGDLQKHLHEIVNYEDIKNSWDDDKYLKPFMQDDSLLYSFDEGEDGEDYENAFIDREKVNGDLGNSDLVPDTKDACVGQNSVTDSTSFEEVRREFDFASTSHVSSSKSRTLFGEDRGEHSDPIDEKPKETHLKTSLIVAGKDIKKVNEGYFGSYSSFGIHREMLSDKVRMDAYMQAILKNPSLFTGAVVMDVGCGTGILSLFAAQAGASRVIAIEASAKMASKATQIAKENGLWRYDKTTQTNQQKGVIEVVQSMVEEIDKSSEIGPHSVDVLISEWMGYCLLYESMLSSVLFARDKWLKPGGAILPDTATIFAAGFGRGGTSLPFWENVYGFNMSCIGDEIVQDAARFPIVDVVDECDLVTDSVVLKTFDLATMKPNEVDFTASIELQPKLASPSSNSTESPGTPIWCNGVVLWFDTGFTRRFCKEMPANLSTSPHAPRTHWSQTILTYREPIALARGNLSNKSAMVGSEACPASRLGLRISIVRATEHRSIDISLETIGFDTDGRKRHLPVQIFNLS